EGRAIRKVRQSVHRLERGGYRAEALPPDRIGPELRRELEEVARAWRGTEPERGFVMALDALFRLEEDDALFVGGFGPDGRAAGPACAEGRLPARQPPALQPEVRPELGAPLRRLRAAARPAARRHRGPRRRGVPAVRGARARRRMSAALLGGLALALASAGALNWGYFAQHRAAGRLP